MIVKVAQGRDADVSTSDPMGVIPAGTLLKTEFSAIVPDTATAEKTLVSKYYCNCMHTVMLIVIALFS